MVDIVRPPLVTRYERPRRTISLYTWGDRPTLNLVGQDVIYGAPGQAPGYSLPQPRFINFPRGVHEQVERSLAIAGAGIAPFNETKWPLPVRSKYRFRYEYPYPLTLVPPVMGFAQRDWPNPVRRKYRFQYEYPHPRTLAPAGPAPFAQPDWPLPRGAASKLSRQDFVSGLPLPVIPSDSTANNRAVHGHIVSVGRMMGR